MLPRMPQLERTAEHHLTNTDSGHDIFGLYLSSRCSRRANERWLVHQSSSWVLVSVNNADFEMFRDNFYSVPGAKLCVPSSSQLPLSECSAAFVFLLIKYLTIQPLICQLPASLKISVQQLATVQYTPTDQLRSCFSNLGS